MFKFLQHRSLFLQIRKYYTDTADYRIYRNRLITEKYKKELKKKEIKKKINKLPSPMVTHTYPCFPVIPPLQK